MKTAKRIQTAALTLALTLALAACGNGGGTSAGSTPAITESPFVLRASDTGAADFAAQHTDYESVYANDVCWNITPGFVSENSDFTVFKYEQSHETFLLYDGAVYPIGSSFGGDGVNSMALADLTGDGVNELYYTFSEDAVSRAAYFDPTAKAETVLSGTVTGQPVVLSADKKGVLTINEAAVSDYESLHSMTLTPGDALANIVSSDGQIIADWYDK